MPERVVVQARLPARLVRELDRLTEEGYYGSRTEAIADAIRHLLERYRRGGRLARMVRLYLVGRRPRPVPLEEVNIEEAMRALRESLGTDDLDRVMDVLRGRVT